MEQRSLTLTGRHQLEWRTKNIPPLMEDEILIKTIAGAVSIGAELPQYNESDRTDVEPTYPSETGYESYGEVIKIGKDVSSSKVGDRVVAFYGHKDYGVVKAKKAIRVPREISYPFALLSILSCDAAKGVLKLQPKKTDRVLVTGMGTMGLLTVYFLKNYMEVKHVDVIDLDKKRCEYATMFGISNFYTNQAECPQNFYECGLECSSSNEAFRTLQKSIRVNGEICILSDGNRDSLNLQADFFKKELKIIGSSDGWDYQEHANWHFSNVEKVPHIEQIFQHQISHQELINCFEELSKKVINPLKVLVKY
ncbi:alcohol dehydrogenase catalytic domain-containing protein [Bacillus spongiae]|uniref:Alcohol dehydrogenase catalytic domain-containing protein n=1 Tax=Bacillus spongiae TaxID=2683610 RepID=A0ABU8HC82_9BACI